MKTGLGLYKKYRKLIALINLLRFNIRKYLIGFDYANLFIQRIDKYSLELILRKNGAKIGENCDIETEQRFHNCKNYKNLSIGGNCHIGKNCFFDLREKIEICNNVVISMQNIFLTHIDLNKSELRKYFPSNKSSIKISDNCYIGANCTIVMGIELGIKSFIAAGSVVTKNVESYTMVGGVPAKEIKKLNE